MFRRKLSHESLSKLQRRFNLVFKILFMNFDLLIKLRRIGAIAYRNYDASGVMKKKVNLVFVDRENSYSATSNTAICRQPSG